MIGSRLAPLASLGALVMACGSGTANVSASAAVSGDAPTSAKKTSDGAPAGPGVKGATKNPSSGSAEPPAAPVHDPALVTRALDESAEAVDARRRLGLRLAVVQQGPEDPWLLAVVNRGTESTRVSFDLRTLSLEVQPPLPPVDPNAKPPARTPKPPKPITCTLPKDIVPTREAENFEVVLAPGEGVVDAFDPRLYCLPVQGTSPLVPGAVVTARLGFAEKTKVVWTKGKPEKRVVEQSPPFVARLAELAKPEPAVPLETKPAAEEGGELAFERYAVKQLVAKSFELDQAYAETPRDTEPTEPLVLRLTRGSDASTEREATVTVSLVNRSPKAQTVYFRRELVSFEIAGPTGMVGCNAGPDERAPERLSFATLAPGKNLSASSRLIELCPQGAMRAPGLYMVHGRFEAREGGEQFGLRAYRGMVVTEKPALVRVRKGWGDMPAQRQPMRVRVGGGPAGEISEKPNP